MWYTLVDAARGKILPLLNSMSGWKCLISATYLLKYYVCITYCIQSYLYVCAQVYWECINTDRIVDAGGSLMRQIEVNTAVTFMSELMQVPSRRGFIKLLIA